MKKRTFFIFTLYTWLRILYGLFLHPYKTVREITRKPVFMPVAASPVFVVLVLFILGRLGAIFLNIYGVPRYMIAMILSISFFSLLLWQIVIFYLLLSLISAKRRE